MQNEYRFVTEWRVKATRETVYRILENATDLVRWWPSVYLDVKETAKGQSGGVGKKIELYTKGWLPYTIRWRFVVTKAEFPTGFSLVAEGDLAGRGEWTFSQQGDICLIRYDWHVLAEKPMLKYFSFLLKPVFSANHHWAMRKGLESLEIELARIANAGKINGKAISSPPGPVFPHNFTNNKMLQ